MSEKIASSRFQEVIKRASLQAGGSPPASTASSLPEVVGEAGIMVEPRDVGGLAEAMGRALMDGGKGREMREKGLRQAARFSWERVAAMTLEIYRSISSPGN